MKQSVDAQSEAFDRLSSGVLTEEEQKSTKKRFID